MTAGTTGATFAAKEVALLSAKPLVEATLGNIIKTGGCVAGAVVGCNFAINGLRLAKESLFPSSNDESLNDEPLSKTVGLVSLAGGITGAVFASKGAIALASTPVVDALIGDLLKTGGCVTGAVIASLVALKGALISTSLK